MSAGLDWLENHWNNKVLDALLSDNFLTTTQVIEFHCLYISDPKFFWEMLKKIRPLTYKKLM